MTSEALRNLLVYVSLWLLMGLASALAVSIGAGVVPLFREGEYLAAGRTEFASALGFLSSGLGVWLAANRPKLGTEAEAKTTKKTKKV